MQMMSRILIAFLVAGAGYFLWQAYKSEPPPLKSELCMDLRNQLLLDENLKPFLGKFEKLDLISRLNDKRFDVEIEKCLSDILRPNSKRPGYKIEFDIFDDSPPVDHENTNTRANKTKNSLAASLETKVVLQISVFDKSSDNKLAETGAGLTIAILERSVKKEQKKTR